MGDFGKVDLAVSLNPTTAFPMDARCYFNSLALAEAAAATAEEIGSSNSVYYYGMKLLVDDGSGVRWYMIQRDKTLREDSAFISLTHAEYKALKDAGKLIPNTPYMIVRDDL